MSSSSDTLRACLFIIVVAVACLSRSYCRNRHGSDGEFEVWQTADETAAGSQRREKAADGARSEVGGGQALERRLETDPNEGSWDAAAVPATAPALDRGRSLSRQSSAHRRSENGSLQLLEAHITEKLSASFDDVQSRRAANLSTSSSTAADYAFVDESPSSKWQPTQRSLGMLDLPSLESLGLDLSETSSPSALEMHFPPAQLRPY